VLTSRVLLVPHWPTMLVDEHRGHRTPMLSALAAQAAQLAAEAPAAIVVLSGRWDSEGPFRVDVGRRHRTLTDYTGLGVEIRYDCPGAPALARALVDAGMAAGVRVGPAERGVDSGVTVPLHFLLPRPRVPVVPLSTAPRTWAECRAWGAVVRRVLAARPERVTFVVGGALSGSLHDWSLRREVPQARELDERVLRALSSGAWDELAGIPPALSERAHPEAGLRHLEVLRGFLGADLSGQVICHESGPGIGGALVQFDLPLVPGVAPPAPALPVPTFAPAPRPRHAGVAGARPRPVGHRRPGTERAGGPRQGAPADRGTRPFRSSGGGRTARGPRPGASSRGPRPGAPSRGPRPGASSRGPRPGASSRGPRPGASSRGPRPGAPSRGPRPGAPSRGPRPGGPSRGPRPEASSRGPRPGAPSRGPRPGGPSRGPRPGAPSRGPRPGASARGPRPSGTSRSGPRSGPSPGRRPPRRGPARGRP